VKPSLNCTQYLDCIRNLVHGSVDIRESIRQRARLLDSCHDQYGHRREIGATGAGAPVAGGNLAGLFGSRTETSGMPRLLSQRIVRWVSGPGRIHHRPCPGKTIGRGMAMIVHVTASYVCWHKYVTPTRNRARRTLCVLRQFLRTFNSVFSGTGIPVPANMNSKSPTKVRWKAAPLSFLPSPSNGCGDLCSLGVATWSCSFVGHQTHR
jgi:hypothetical protein